jgi:glycosyltransferase involved in cell wall biosynthesis
MSGNPRAGLERELDTPTTGSRGDVPEPDHRATVSVIVPTYNGASFIRDTITSLLDQTVLPDEIIVVDDCSTDGTLAVVRELARSAAAPVRILQTRRNSGGPAAPINAGVEAATSDLIAVQEQDDRPTPIRIARSQQAARLLPCAGLICGRVRMRSSTGAVREDLWKDGHLQFSDLSLLAIAPGVYRAEADDMFQSLLRRNIVFTNSNVMFPRAIWKRVGGFDSGYPICADLDFNLKVARESPVVIIDEVMCEYHQHHDSLYNRNVDLAGDSPAHLEAAFIRVRHALRHYPPSTTMAEEWYWEGRHLLASSCRRRDWKRGYEILSLLCSSRALQSHAMKRLRRLIVSR